MVIKALLMGIFATIAIDLWALFSNRVLSLPKPNWAMVGRWLGHIPKRVFIHNPIASSAEIANERLLGWVFHYCIGILYAAFYLIIVSYLMGGEPTLISAWLFGLVTVLAAWFVMQPCLGVGIFAVKATQPNLVRVQNLIVHTIFGMALYGGWIGIEKLS